MLMKKSLLLILALLTSMLASAQNEQLYGVYQGTGSLVSIGTQKAETYDVAMHLTDPALAGLEIRGINVPIRTEATGITSYKAWITKELTLESNQIAPDVDSISFTPDGKWVEVTFRQPYVLTAEGVYVGYSFTVPSVDTSNDSDPAKTPVMCIASTNTSNLYIHTSRTYRKWKLLEETTLTAGRAPAFVVRLGGDRIRQNAASFSAPDELDAYAMLGKQKTFSLTLNNHGTANISRIEYEVTVDGQVVDTQSKSVSLKGTYYGQHTTVKVNVPAQETAGAFSVGINVKKVNGVDNEDADPITTFNMAFLSEMPKHKPLMEEYTGGWCGYCPRGMAAMEAMTEKHGDEFVGVAYHNGDPMQITNNTPNTPSGYPHAYIDRVIDTDPFFGTSNSSLGIEKDWKNRQTILTPAALELKATWTDDTHTAIAATARASFIFTLEDNPYQLSYILVADDLHSTSSKWNQSNYYSGDGTSDPYLKSWAQQAATIRDLHFNDVAIQLSCQGSAALENSLPQHVTATQRCEHTYTFDISANSLVQDKSQLRVVAVLINTRTGEVANAEKANVPDPEETGISEHKSDVITATYTDLAGRRVNSPVSGIYVKTVTRSDGTRQSYKIIHQ